MKHKDIDNKQVETRQWLSDAILIAVISALSYMFTYQFEAGYAKAFKIPSELIDVSLSAVLALTSFLVGATFLMFFVLNPFVGVLNRRSRNKFFNAFKTRLIVLLLYIAYSIIMINSWVITSITISILFIILYVPALIVSGVAPIKPDTNLTFFAVS